MRYPFLLFPAIFSRSHLPLAAGSLFSCNELNAADKAESAMNNHCGHHLLISATASRNKYLLMAEKKASCYVVPLVTNIL